MKAALMFRSGGGEYQFIRTARFCGDGVIVVVVNSRGKLDSLTLKASEYLKLDPYDMPDGLKESIWAMNAAESEMLDLEDRLDDARSVFEEEQENVHRILKEAMEQ